MRDKYKMRYDSVEIRGDMIWFGTYLKFKIFILQVNLILSLIIINTITIVVVQVRMIKNGT